jgi:hypothetical protein
MSPGAGRKDTKIRSWKDFDVARVETLSQLALSEFKEQNHHKATTNFGTAGTVFGRQAVVREQNRLYVHPKEKRTE